MQNKSAAWRRCGRAQSVANHRSSICQRLRVVAQLARRGHHISAAAATTPAHVATQIVASAATAGHVTNRDVRSLARSVLQLQNEDRGDIGDH
jgi:hypothetical protein